MFKMDVITKGPIFSLRRRKEATDFAVRSAMEDSTARLLREVKLGTPVSTKTLRRSIDSKIEGRGTKLKGIVFTSEKYGLPVERGQRPHFPNVDNIEAWLRRPAKTLKIEGTIRQIAFLVGRKIARTGVQGKKMFELGLRQSTSYILGRFKDIGITMKRKLE